MKYLLIFLLSITTVFGEGHLKMLRDSCKFPKTAIAIMNHESNYGKSKLAVNYNNLFGFKGGKFASGRTKSGYSIYDSKEDSIMSYIHFERRIIRRYNVKSRREYLVILNRIYAKDPSWIDKISKHI